MADVANFTRNVGGSAVGAVKTLRGELDNASKAGKLDKVTQAATGLGLGLLGVAATAVKMAADFDKAMSGVKAATHAGAAEIAQLRAAAIEAGKSSQYSATEAAGAVTELAKAGVSTADILGGGLKGALSLAAAGQLDVGEAAETAASALTQFKLSGDQVPHVADLLAAAAGKAQGSVHDMGYALNQSGLVAAQFGLSIEDTTGALAEFAANGLLGSDAGTSFKTMLLAIANPTKVTANQMAELGISFYDAQGKFVGISGVAQELRDKLKGLTDQQRQQALGQIFGNDAIRAASILYKDGASGVQQWAKAVNDSGYAQKTAAALTDNLAGDLERLKGSLETMAIESGSGANSGLRVLTKTMGVMVDEVGKLPPAVGSTLVVLTGLGGALLLGVVGWAKYRAAIAAAQEQMIATGPAGAKAAAGLRAVQGAMGPLLLGFAALEAFKAVFDYFGPAAADVDKLTNSLQTFADTGKVTGEMAADFGTDMKDFRGEAGLAAQATGGFTKSVNDLLNTVGSGAVADWLAGLTGTSTFNTATADMKSYDAALTSVMTTSGDARKASELWNHTLEQSGLDTDQLAKILPSAYKKVGELNNAADKATIGTKGLNSALQDGATSHEQYKNAADAAAGAVRGERDALFDLAKAQRGEVDPVFALITAQDNLTVAQKNATRAIKDHGKNSTEAKKATRDLAGAAIDLQSKVGGLSDTFNGKMTPELRATLKAAKLTDAQIDELSGQFVDAKKAGDGFAKDYKATVSATGVPGVKKQLTMLALMQDALKKGLPASAIAAANKNTKQGFSAGGWTGPGDTYDEAGIVHGDEFVTKKKSRRKLEAKYPGMLDYQNEYGELPPGYAHGGRVKWPFPVTASMTKIPSRADAIAAMGAFSGPAPHGALAAWIRAAEGLTGTPSSWTGPLNVLIHRESGGNPRAINLTDSNAKAGHPSKGLMQTIPSTFEHYRLHSLPDDIYNPVANIVAGIRYIKSRYGSIFNVQQANPNKPPKGYSAGGHVAMAGGGVINEPVFGYGASGRSYSFGEGGRPETVMPGVWTTGRAAGGGTAVINRTVTLAPVFNINGSNLTADQISTRVNRQLGALMDQYTRGK
jgi:TP901 family phage tail tape measure protein